MPPPHTAVLGSWDFAPYLRVGPDDGLDPYGQTYEDPAFSESAISEGQPLIAITAKNREGVFPVFLGSATSPLNKDQMHALQRTAASACKAAPTLQWKDAGASNSTFWDVTYARFEPTFHYRRSQKGWLAGVVRVFSQPPYGHTGSYTQLPGGSAMASGLTVTLPLNPTIGDAPGLLNVQIGLGSNMVDRENGRLVGFSVVPSGQQVEFVAASLPQLYILGTIRTDAQAVGSLVMARSIEGGIPNPEDIYTRIDLSPASLYKGRQRIFGMMRNNTNTFFNVAGPLVRMLDEAGNQLGPDAAATTQVFGFGPVDLGVLNVAPASGQATVSAYFSAPVQLSIDRFLVLPEESTTYLLDTDVTQWAGDGDLSNIASGTLVDDYNQPYATPPNLRPMLDRISGALAIPSANLGGATLCAINVNAFNEPALHLRDFRLHLRSFALPFGAASGGAIMIGKNQTSLDDIWSALLGKISGTQYWLALNVDGFAGPLGACTAINFTTQPVNLELDVRFMGQTMRSRLWANGSMVASIAYATPAIRKTGVPWMGIIASTTTQTGAMINVWRVSDVASVGFAPRDVYALGPDEAVHYDSGGGYERHLDQFRRAAQPMASIGAGPQQVVAFNLGLGDNIDNDAISASVRIRERFTFAR